MTNNFLFLRERESVRLGEYSKGKFAEVGYDGKTAFVYGEGQKKVKNIVTIPFPEHFSYDVFKSLLDSYGFNAVANIFSVSGCDCATRFAYFCFSLFSCPEKGRARFDKFQKIWNLCLEMQEILKVKWGYEERLDNRDRRCYSYDNISYQSVNPYPYLENSFRGLFITELSLDVFDYEIALKRFISGLILSKKLVLDGFKDLGHYELDCNRERFLKDSRVFMSVYNGNLVEFPEFYSLIDLVDWVFGKGFGERLSNALFEIGIEPKP